MRSTPSMQTKRRIDACPSERSACLQRSEGPMHKVSVGDSNGLPRFRELLGESHGSPVGDSLGLPRDFQRQLGGTPPDEDETNEESRLSNLRGKDMARAGWSERDLSNSQVEVSVPARDRT